MPQPKTTRIIKKHDVLSLTNNSDAMSDHYFADNQEADKIESDLKPNVKPNEEPGDSSDRNNWDACDDMNEVDKDEMETGGVRSTRRMNNKSLKTLQSPIRLKR